jgi:integrase
MRREALRSAGVPRVTLGDALGAYLDSLGHPEHRATARQYGITLRRLAASLGGDRDVASVTGAELLEWVTVTAGDRKPATWNLSRTAVRSAWRWLGGAGWADASVADVIPPRRKAPERDRAIPRDVLDALLSDTRIALRDRALWRLMYESAAREAEVLRLNVRDVDAAHHRAAVTRKAGAADTITWRGGTAQLLPRLLKGRKSGPVFTTRARAPAGTPLADVAPDGTRRLSCRQAQARFREATMTLPGGPYTLHQLRHSALSQAADEGASTPMMMALSGHTSVRSLARYARVSAGALGEWQAGRDEGRRR